MKFTRCIAGSYGWRQGWFIRFPYNREFLEEFKDAIESEGRSWDAETKTWWVDKSFGSLLKELFENWSHPVELITIKKVACALCKGTGLIPFKNKEGKLIPHTFLHCDCHQDEREHYQGLSPQDFDFPVSSSFYRDLCQEYKWPEPEHIEPKPQEEIQEQVIVHRHSSMQQQEYEIVQGMSKRIESLEKKLAEKQKPRTEYA